MAYETILAETRGRVGLITLNRPQALNALNSTLVGEINQALDGFEADPGIGCTVITGSEKAFAAGADIKEMQGLSYPQTYLDDFITAWDRVANRRKADHRRSRRVCPRRRLRARHDVRFHHRGRQCEIRPARDQARRHARAPAARSASPASSARRRPWRCASRAA
jgi:enoyl-CoA hydratase/carnithine racemase